LALKYLMRVKNFVWIFLKNTSSFFFDKTRMKNLTARAIGTTKHGLIFINDSASLFYGSNSRSSFETFPNNFIVPVNRRFSLIYTHTRTKNTLLELIKSTGSARLCISTIMKQINFFLCYRRNQHLRVQTRVIKPPL
jgi:hypothetical protein